MTNEEKAKALFYHFCTEKTCGGYDSCENCPKSKSHEALLEMAEWKDKQSKEEFMSKLDRALDWIQKRRSKYFFTDKMTFDFINDFKKAMEEEL